MGSQPDYERFFREADADGSGSLSVGELVKMLRRTGFCGCDDDIKAQFRSCDASDDGMVTMEEFLMAMGEIPQENHRKALMRQVFNDFDGNSNGEIDRAEIGRFFEDLKRSFTEGEVENMMSQMDQNDDNAITLEEFLAVSM